MLFPSHAYENREITVTDRIRGWKVSPVEKDGFDHILGDETWIEPGTYELRVLATDRPEEIGGPYVIREVYIFVDEPRNVLAVETSRAEVKLVATG